MNGASRSKLTFIKNKAVGFNRRGNFLLKSFEQRIQNTLPDRFFDARQSDVGEKGRDCTGIPMD